MCPQATLHGAGKQSSTAARGSLTFVLLPGANPMYQSRWVNMAAGPGGAETQKRVADETALVAGLRGGVETQSAAEMGPCSFPR